MNYQETLDFLFTRLPVYQREGKAAYKIDLGNTERICELLDHPEKRFKSVHIAGTNGKGSTAHMLASVLHEAGYRTGLYTSPHLKDFRERIKINGEMISEHEVIRFVEERRDILEEIRASFFEWTVGLAFHYFAREQVDIAVIETGLGGRLDSTNVITPEVSVITNIAKDHTAFLGEDLVSIAKEKAGIIKQGIPVVVGEKQEETAAVFKEKAGQCNSSLIFASEVKHDKAESDLLSPVQQKNIKTVLSTVHVLKKSGWKVTDKALRQGIKNTVSNTGLQGRWQKLGEHPLVICDVAHNEAGIEEAVKTIRKEKYRKLHMVFGSVNDKNIDAILKLLPTEAEYYFCRAGIPRALDENELQSSAEKAGLTGQAYPSVRQAIKAAKSNAGKEDMIFIGGSTFVVAEAL